MPRAFLITNKRYDTTSSSSSSSSISDTDHYVYVHSRDNSPERSVRTAEERHTPIGRESESSSVLKPSSPGSSASLYNRISVLVHNTTIIKHESKILNSKREFISKCEDQCVPLKNQLLSDCSSKYIENGGFEDDDNQVQDLSIHHLKNSYYGFENTESSSASSSSSYSPIGSPKHNEHLILSNDIHICPDCGKRYSTSSNLARHRQTHRSVTDKKARKCPHCDKVYVSMPAYSMHVRTHTQGCVCSYCGKCFSRPWLLQGHIRTHTGEKPFKCPICSKAFADKSNLRAHVQTHSTTKPYACQRCGKAFALKSYLYKHEESSCMRIHRHTGHGQQRSVAPFIDDSSRLITNRF